MRLVMTPDPPVDGRVGAPRGQPADIARYARIGWRIGRVLEEYRTRLPFREEAALLEMPDDAPVRT